MWKKCNWFRSLFLPNAPLQYTPQWLEIKQERFLIRELELGDIKELLAVQRLTYDGQTPWTRSGFLSELYSRYTHLYLGVVHEEKVIGFMGVRLFLEDGHITNIAIIPKFQGWGLGTFLLQEAEIFAKSHRCQTMSLEVRKSNSDAQRLYRRLGYVSRRVLPNYYNENNEDAIDMVKYLC